MDEKKLTDENSMFNYIANDILGEVKPLYLRKRIVREIFDLIHRQKAEIERLTKALNKQRNLYLEEFGSNANALSKNAELQSEIDKLKERNYWLESEHEHQCEKSYFEGVEKGESKADERIKEILTELYDKPYEIDVQVKGYEFHKEAIETVAKSILKSINERINSIADKYGIQLEQKEDD